MAEGRLKERGLRELGDDYRKRIRRHVRCDEIEVRDSVGLLRAVPPGSSLVALDVTGEAHSSTDFARRVERWGSTGKGILTFAIGGAEGLSGEVLRASHARLSLSSMTLPHRLARLVLLEQLYRAMTILRNEPYAREG